MNRRSFLTTLAAAAAGLALDPERLLWVPGKKTIFLPPVRPVVPAPKEVVLIPANYRLGDVVTIDGCYARSPTTGLTIPYLQYFVVTEITHDRINLTPNAFFAPNGSPVYVPPILTHHHLLSPVVPTSAKDVA